MVSKLIMKELNLYVMKVWVGSVFRLIGISLLFFVYKVLFLIFWYSGDVSSSDVSLFLFNGVVNW